MNDSGRPGRPPRRATRLAGHAPHHRQRTAARGDLPLDPDVDLIEVRRQRRLAGEIPVPVILHICGNTSDRVGMIAETGLSCFHWDTKSGPPGAFRDVAGPRLALMGGVSNLTLLSGTPQAVAAQVRAARAADMDVIGPECAIPLATPLANLKAVVSP